MCCTLGTCQLKLTGASAGSLDGIRSERGSLLLEQVIALAIVAILVPGLLTGLSVIIKGASAYGDRGAVLQLAQAQMESVQQQAFQPSPASYALISPPTGYAITVTTSSAQQYTYAGGLPAPEVVQAVTVTVSVAGTGRESSVTVEGYKLKP